jgi:hypothetical protein
LAHKHSFCAVHHIKEQLIIKTREIEDYVSQAKTSQEGFNESVDDCITLDRQNHIYHHQQIKKKFTSVSAVLDLKFKMFKQVKTTIMSFHRHQKRQKRQDIKIKLSMASTLGSCMHALASQWWISSEVEVCIEFFFLSKNASSIYLTTIELICFIVIAKDNDKL